MIKIDVISLSVVYPGMGAMQRTPAELSVFDGPKPLRVSPSRISVDVDGDEAGFDWNGHAWVGPWGEFATTEDIVAYGRSLDGD